MTTSTPGSSGPRPLPPGPRPGPPPAGPRPPLRGPWPPPAPAYPEGSQGILALVLGILSVLSVPLLGPVAWWLGLADRRAVDAGRRDPSGRGAAVAGYVLGIIGTVILGVGLLAFLAFAGVFLVVALIGLSTATVAESAAESAGDRGRADDSELRAQWLAAEPRDRTDSGDGTADPDRCDPGLQGWLEEQFRTGMTADEVTDAVGDPDSVRPGDGGDEAWLWNLGVCTFVDYDTYRLEFRDGRLAAWGRVPG